jgi:hypothetical protein
VLWVGTNKGGLNRYDQQTERFNAYMNDPNDPESLSLNAINAIVEDQDGYLWVATDGQGVNRFDRRTGKFKRFINDPADPENRRLNIVNDLYLDQSGVLWLGTSLGLSGMNLRGDEVKRYRHDPGDPQSLSHNRVNSITEDRDGSLWLGTPNGLTRFDRANGRFTRFFNDPQNPASLSYNLVWSIHEDRAGRLWIDTGGGLDIPHGSYWRDPRHQQRHYGHLHSQARQELPGDHGNGQRRGIALSRRFVNRLGQHHGRRGALHRQTERRTDEDGQLAATYVQRQPVCDDDLHGDGDRCLRLPGDGQRQRRRHPGQYRACYQHAGLDHY